MRIRNRDRDRWTVKTFYLLGRGGDQVVSNSPSTLTTSARIPLKPTVFFSKNCALKEQKWRGLAH